MRILLSIDPVNKLREFCALYSEFFSVCDKARNVDVYKRQVEIMCCPGGCVNGGGQPQVHADVRNFEDVKAIRAKRCV